MEKNKSIKYVGPSKKMIKALDDEGLNINWPKTGNIKDEELLAIDGIFETGEGWEKCVLIDLRRMTALESKAGVDKAIANQLQEEYDNFDIEEEMKINLGANGAPDVARLYEDMKEQETCLERFAEVANAVAEGRPVPPKKDEEEESVHITPATASQICFLLKELTRAVGNKEFLYEDEVQEVILELEGKKGM